MNQYIVGVLSYIRINIIKLRFNSRNHINNIKLYYIISPNHDAQFLLHVTGQLECQVVFIFPIKLIKIFLQIVSNQHTPLLTNMFLFDHFDFLIFKKKKK